MEVAAVAAHQQSVRRLRMARPIGDELGHDQLGVVGVRKCLVGAQHRADQSAGVSCPRDRRGVGRDEHKRAYHTRAAPNHDAFNAVSARGPWGNGANVRGVPIDAVLFDRDGTLVVDVPYNGDAGAVRPVPGARRALYRLRAASRRVGIVSNQSGIARGLLRAEDADTVFARVDELLGPFEVIVYCPHDDGDSCACRKPQPGLVLEAAERLGVAPNRCAVVGDIGADVHAALAAGAWPILVPNEHTRPAEIVAAPVVVPDLGAAVDLVLDAVAPSIALTGGRRPLTGANAGEV